ncbi:hypothetical protein AHAS_Ahas09G0106500 [Arachis hypogaea]
MSNEKKALVMKIEFGALRHISSLNVTHNPLRELVHSFDLYKSSLDTRYREIKITPTKIRDALNLNRTSKIFLVYSINQILVLFLRYFVVLNLF